jgi:hypothetical protein
MHENSLCFVLLLLSRASQSINQSMNARLAGWLAGWVAGCVAVPIPHATRYRAPDLAGWLAGYEKKKGFGALSPGLTALVVEKQESQQDGRTWSDCPHLHRLSYCVLLSYHSSLYSPPRALIPDRAN